jgi:hypothetical protein
MKVEISNGELIDKMVILRIKRERIQDEQSLANVARELAVIEAASARLSPPPPDDLIAELKSINDALWVIEDDIREKEARQEFDEEFIRLARSVYVTNDRRADTKRQINDATGSELVEEKSYRDYSPDRDV